MDLYLAGSQSNFGNILDVYEVGYNRLLSYDYQRAFVDKLIQKKKEMDLYLAGSDKFGSNERNTTMDLYLAGSNNEKSEVFKGIKPSNVLFSYEFLQKQTDKDIPYITQCGGKLFIDSGAFSAWTKGITIDVDKYIDWLNERSEYLTLFGQVDVIPGNRNSSVPVTQDEVQEAAKKTWQNYLYMRSRLKQPEKLLYTFHVGEPFDFLKQAVEWKDENGNYIPYIAFGGMVGKSTQIRKNFLDKCYEIIFNSSNPNIKVHAFGMTSKELLDKYPITSADSTSWIMTAATGGIMTDIGTVTVSDKQKNLPTHYSHLPEEFQDSFNKTIQNFGFTLEELAKERTKRVLHNARYMKDYFSKIEYRPNTKKKRLF